MKGSDQLNEEVPAAVAEGQGMFKANPFNKGIPDHQALQDAIQPFLDQRGTEHLIRQFDEPGFRDLFEWSGMGVAVITQGGTAFLVNKYLEEMLGYSQQELREMTFSQFTHPEDLAKDRDLYYRLLNGEISCYQIEKRYITKVGSIKWAHLFISLLRDEDGGPLYALGLIYDVTKKKLAEMGERTWSTMFRHSRLPMAVVGLDEQVNTSNEALSALLAVPVEQLHGRKIASLFVTPSATKLNELLAQAVQKGYVSFEAELKRQESTLPVSVNLAAIHDEEEPISILLLQLLDISNQKQVEQSLKEKTAQLMRMNEDLRQFAYVASHNLRSPLNQARALLELHSISKQPEEQALLLSKLRSSIDALGTTLQDLLELLHKRDESVMPAEEVEFESLLQEVEQSVEGQIISSGATIETSFEVNSIRYPRSYLQSILLNLLTNAIKYRHPERPLKVLFATRQENQFVVLTVKDNASGMNLKEFGSKIFKLFQSYHNGPESKGLGLYIVKQQVEVMGGHIEVSSEVGQGTTFHLYLVPARKATDLESSPVDGD